jgi:hypothetical protein
MHKIVLWQHSNMEMINVAVGLGWVLTLDAAHAHSKAEQRTESGRIIANNAR